MSNYYTKGPWGDTDERIDEKRTNERTDGRSKSGGVDGVRPGGRIIEGGKHQDGSQDGSQGGNVARDTSPRVELA